MQTKVLQAGLAEQRQKEGRQEDAQLTTSLHCQHQPLPVSELKLNTLYCFAHQVGPSTQYIPRLGRRE